jgi:hypothetical protein
MTKYTSTDAIPGVARAQPITYAVVHVSPVKPEYQPKTGAKCGCRPGQQRDNCPNCEGTGQVIDFVAIRAR